MRDAEKTKEQLIEELEQLRALIRSGSIVESANSIILRMDIKGNILYINKYALDLFGFEHSEIIGKNVVGTIVPEVETTGRDLNSFIEDLLINPQKYEINENENIRKNGQRLWISWTNKAICDSEGNVTEILCIGNDITQHKKMQDELVRSKLFLEAVLDCIEDGIVACDGDGVLKLFNRATQKFHGLPAEPLLPDKWADYYDLYHADGKTKMSMEDVPLFRTLKGEEVTNVEMVIAPKGSSPYILSATGRTLIDSNGDNIGAVVSMHNITESKKVENELTNAYSKLEKLQKQLTEDLKLQSEIISNMSEGINLINVSDGSILYCNPKFEQMFGYNPGELIGKNVSVVNAPTEKSSEETAKEIITSINKNNFWQGEIQNIKKTGERFWCHATVSTFEHSEHGKVWISVHTDITERKKASEDLERFFDLAIDMLCITEIDGYFKVLSPSFEKTLGFTLDELKSKPYMEFIHPEDIQTSLNAVETALHGIPLYSFKNRFLCKDGTYKFLSWTVLPVPSEGISYCTATDVTEQLKIQDIMNQDLVLQSSIAKVTEALLNPENDKYYISKIVHDESLLLTESEHGYASLICENDDNMAVNLTDMVDKQCKVAKEQQTAIFPKGPNGYNALWGHSLNTGEGFFTNAPKEHISYKGCTPAGHVEIKNFLSVPVKSRGKIIGQIALANSRRDYTERDLSIIERLASIYSVAIERKHIEQRLSESEQRFRVIFNETPIGIAITEINTGKFVQVNKAYCNIIGYSHDEIVNFTFRDITHPDDIQQQLDGLRQLYNGDISVYNMEKRYILKDAKVVWVSLTCVPFSLGANQPLFNLNIVKDITNEKQLSDDLKASQLDVIEAQSKAHFGTWTYDPMSRQPQWSLEMFNIWGLDPKQGAPHYSEHIKYIHPDDYRRFDDAVSEAVELGKPYDLEIRIIHPDKTERIVNTICEPVLDALGKVVKLRGSNLDITERKKMETQLRELNKNLETMVAVETEKRRVHEQMLIQQSKMASMGEMIGLIAHQWKQPINAVGLKVQDLQDSYAYGEVNDKYIGNLVDSTMHQIDFMAKTIDDFRNFFIPSKKKVLFDVKTAIEELLSMFISVFSKSNIDVSVKADKYQILPVKGYPNELKQVILNILNNSRDAIVSRKKNIPEIKGNIEISINNNEDKSKVTVSIIDNGGGIPDDIIDKIFEPYFTTKEKEGTGIGLYMSKTIIETNMGGTLQVKNIADGVEFMISFDVNGAGDVSTG
ncbi:MAG: PAS domain S-box protein [Nitrospirae bacterium YQR-1]